MTENGLRESIWDSWDTKTGGGKNQVGEEFLAGL